MRIAFSDTYGPASVLRVQDAPTPAPRDDQLLVRVHAATLGITDAVARRGSPAFSRLFFGLRRPKRTVLGTDFAGVVEAIGPAVTHFGVGDEVFGTTGPDFGAHAEYVRLSQDAAIAPKPTNLGHAEAAALVDATALVFLRDRAKLRAGQRIAITGASGSVGSMAVQLARHFGAEVTAVCSTPGMELVRGLGADTVVDRTQEDFTRAGRTYDVIFDAAGHSSFGRCRTSLAADGIYLTPTPSLAIMLQMPLTAALGRRKAAIAFTGLRPPAEKAVDLRLVKTLAEAGTLIPVIDTRYPLHQIADAHAHVERGKRGNVVVTFPIA